MDTLPRLPAPLPWPVSDSRTRLFVGHYSDMHSLVAALVLPEHAPAYVVSVLETSHQQIRHSYYRYKSTTVAVAHSLFALEHALAEHLGRRRKTMQQLIDHHSGLQRQVRAGEQHGEHRTVLTAGILAVSAHQRQRSVRAAQRPGPQGSKRGVPRLPAGGRPTALGRT
ncbi:hypothetical protein ABZW10_32315 [Kitasatospora sp. NPDC004723]|uniref:hypothetical protein n=1 Tax=Kitasatospora sp. NPDC004723 TaxID=3154288 RepID=UPI0033A50393